MADVGVGEIANFQVNNDEQAQSPMEEQHVHSKPFVADAQPLLSRDKREFAAEFQQEVFKMTD